jgi:hypothetical protein
MENVERTEYVTVIFDLVPDRLGNRRKAVDITGDVIFIDSIRSTADLSECFIGVDDKDLIPCNLTSKLDIRPKFFRKIKVEWGSVNDNKTLYLIVGREASLEITPPSNVVVVDENVLPRDEFNNIRTNTVYKTRIVLFDGEVNSNGNTPPIDVSNYRALEILVAVYDISGTLSVYIEGVFETIHGGYYVFKPLVFHENITDRGARFFTITNLAFRYIRVRWTISGRARFGVYAEAST